MKTALVIGASRGIGAAVASEMTQGGYHTYGTHRGSGVPDGVSSLEADITDSASISDAIQAITNAHNRLDVLVIASGITKDALLLRQTPDDLRTVFEVNALGPIAAVKAALRPMLKARSGSIVALGSISARLGVPGQTNYTASKAALEGFARSFAREYAKHGIRMNVVAPGPTETEMLAAMPAAEREHMIAQIPMGRAASAMEIAQVVRWVSESTFMTGATVPVAGGLQLG